MLFKQLANEFWLSILLPAKRFSDKVQAVDWVGNRHEDTLDELNRRVSLFQEKLDHRSGEKDPWLFMPFLPLYRLICHYYVKIKSGCKHNRLQMLDFMAKVENTLYKKTRASENEQ